MNNPFFCNWRTVSLAVPALMMVLAPVARAADGWMTNYGEAKTLAAKENKDILMDFTGSDWCVACAVLKKEVFSQDVFRQEAPKHFVLLMLDYPQQKPLSAELTAQNEKLQLLYNIDKFPTLLLTDAKGRPYATAGYDDRLQGPEAYNELFAKLRKVKTARDEAFKKSETAEGLEKAKSLYEGLKAMGSEIATAYYKEEFDKIIEADTADTLGLKAKKEYQAKREALETMLEELQSKEKTSEYTAAVDAFIDREKVKGVELQDLLLTKLAVLGPADLAKAPALLDEVIKVDETSLLAERARSIQGRVKVMMEQIEKSQKDPGAGAEDPVAGAKATPAPAPEPKN